MNRINMNLIHINYGGPVVKLVVGHVTHTFEMHKYCGPIRLRADGDTPAKRQWGEKSSFWPVFKSWVNAGSKVNADGFGIQG